MIIIFYGGLGNQMFQYAFYLAKKKVSSNVYINTYFIQRERCHNGFELERLFGIKTEDSSLSVRIVRKLLIFKRKKYFKTISIILLNLLKLTGNRIIQEEGHSLYNSDYLAWQKGRVLYLGFWQTSLYFTSLTKEIKEAFSFNSLQISDKSKALLTKIQSEESVSIHVRRGDFLTADVQNAVCDKAYYLKAIEWINSLIPDLFFVFFSDEPEWAKENIPLPRAVYVDWNHGKESWQDMYLMSKCKHNIIANSTFSWWGAWLNDNPEKRVIAPTRFLNNAETPDIYPATWITIS